MVDGIVGRLHDELGPSSRRSPPAGSPGAVVPYCDSIDVVDDLLTLTGLRTDLGAQPGPPKLDRACVLCTTPGRSAASRSPTASCSRRWPASATGSCACRPSATAPGSRSREMISSFAIHYGNRKTLDELLVDPPASEGPVSIQLFGQDPEIMRSAAAQVAARRRRPARPQHGLPGPEGDEDRRGRGAAQGPRHRGRGRPRRARGLRPAGHRQAARGDEAGRRRGLELARGSSTRPASPASPSTRAAPRSATRAAGLRPRRASSSRSCPCR